MKMKNLPPELDLIHETKRRTEYYFFIFLFESIIDQSQNQLKKNNFQCREGRNLNIRVKDNILTLFPHPDCYCCFSCLCIHGIEQDTTLCLLLLLTHKQRHWSLREKGGFPKQKLNRILFDNAILRLCLCLASDYNLLSHFNIQPPTSQPPSPIHPIIPLNCSHSSSTFSVERDLPLTE